MLSIQSSSTRTTKEESASRNSATSLSKKPPNSRARSVLSSGWVHVQAPTELAIAKATQPGQQLALGETHAIALALQLKADELLMSERRSRQVAQNLELSVIGVFGVIVLAKKRELIPSVRRLMDTLVEQAGFRISHRLYQKILRFADEI